jgi:hypothetical protein
MDLHLQNAISLAIIGCVSAGKSTLVNAILVNKLESTTFKRSTMLPHVYVENDKEDRLSGESISSISSILVENDRENQAILKGDVELTDSTCLPIYHEIPKCYDLIDLPEGVGLNIYDIPGLNDSCYNLVRAMYQYRLRQLDFDDYDEDFGEFLLDFMIALDRCGNEQCFNVHYHMINRPYTREEKKNMMSLFDYMMELYRNCCGEDED